MQEFCNKQVYIRICIRNTFFSRKGYARNLADMSSLLDRQDASTQKILDSVEDSNIPRNISSAGNHCAPLAQQARTHTEGILKI
jgi:hypothetical protein